MTEVAIMLIYLHCLYTRTQVSKKRQKLNATFKILNQSVKQLEKYNDLRRVQVIPLVQMAEGRRKYTWPVLKVQGEILVVSVGTARKRQDTSAKIPLKTSKVDLDLDLGL